MIVGEWLPPVVAATLFNRIHRIIFIPLETKVGRMIWRRIQSFRRRVHQEFEDAFQQAHTPHQIAASFAIGLFVTALPTLGAGLLLFVYLVSVLSWVNKIALFSSVLVLNPVVKPVVYVASVQIGGLLFSSEPVTAFEVGLLNTVGTLVRQLLIGNILVALVLAIVGYGIIYRLTVVYRRRNFAIEDEVLEAIDPDL